MTDRQTRAFRVAIGDRLRSRRLALGLTQEDLAWDGGVSQGSVSLYEQGKLEVPLSVLITLCRVLRISALEICPELRM